MLPDVCAAVQEILRSSLSHDVYGEELPNQGGTMPRKCIVVSSAGGFGSRGFLTTNNLRVDVRCYGESPAESREVWREVYEALKNFTAQTVVVDGSEEVKILSIYEESHAFSSREPDTRWPFTTGLWNVMARDVPSVTLSSS